MKVVLEAMGEPSPEVDHRANDGEEGQTAEQDRPIYRRHELEELLVQRHVERTYAEEAAVSTAELRDSIPVSCELVGGL